VPQISSTGGSIYEMKSHSFYNTRAGKNEELIFISCLGDYGSANTSGTQAGTHAVALVLRRTPIGGHLTGIFCFDTLIAFLA